MCQTENASFSEWTVIENHPADSRVKVCENGIFQTLPSRMGTGGGNVPMVMEDNVESVVRRLTPAECERLQGFPSVQEIRFTEMTKDEYIAWNINEGNIIVNTEKGKVFTTRGPGGVCSK